MKTTTKDIERIITGENIEIKDAYPLADREEGFRWFMRQPSDWLFEMAGAVRDAAFAEIMAMDELQPLKAMPPTEDFNDSQGMMIVATRARITELENRTKHLTPEEELELENLRSTFANLTDPQNYSRAQQIANSRASQIFESYLMPRVIVDAKNVLLWDVNTPEGKAEWMKVARYMRRAARGTYYEILFMVQQAKNSSPGQSSASE